MNGRTFSLDPGKRGNSHHHHNTPPSHNEDRPNLACMQRVREAMRKTGDTVGVQHLSASANSPG